jgi:nucleotide-binding universal stress UspA family protein
MCIKPKGLPILQTVNQSPMAQLLVPFDFSENAQLALDQALWIAHKGNVSVEVLHITNKAVSREYPSSWNCDENSIETLRQKTEAVIEERLRALNLNVQSQVLATVKEDALVTGGITSHMMLGEVKLLVMGTHGRTGVYDSIFGSNTSVMVNHAVFPVLTVPHGWKPVAIEHCIAAIKLSKLNANAKTIAGWGQFLNCTVEAVQFSIIPEAEKELAAQSSIAGIPCRMIKDAIETTLAEDLLQFTAPLQNTILLLFTRDKTFLGKIFSPNLSYKLSGSITIPMLSQPIDNDSKA